MNCFGRSLLTTVRVVIVDDGRTLVITQLDHCNSVLVATFVYLQDRLQSVLNAAARLVYSRRTSEHTTPLLRELYWLRVPERIQFRLCILAYHCVHGTPRAYLSDSLRPTSEIVARRCLRSADTTTLQVPLTRRATLCLSGGCSAGIEQSATRDSDLTCDIPKGDQVSPFSSVIRLTWRCPFRPSADVCVELYNSFRCRFCKVPPQLCDGSTVVHDILVVVVAVAVVVVVVVVVKRCAKVL